MGGLWAIVWYSKEFGNWVYFFRRQVTGWETSTLLRSLERANLRLWRPFGNITQHHSEMALQPIFEPSKLFQFFDPIHSRPPLWSSGQSSWLQIQRSGFDSRSYQILWEVVGLERSPLSLASTTEELPGRKSSGSSLESREYGRRDPSRWPLGTL
jgi:hypothetical protein